MNDFTVSAPLPSPTEVGRLGVYHLKRAWARRRPGRPPQACDQAEFHRDRLVFHGLGLGLEQTLQYLGQGAASFAEFEQWVVAAAGEVPALQVKGQDESQRVVAVELEELRFDSGGLARPVAIPAVKDSAFVNRDRL